MWSWRFLPTPGELYIILMPWFLILEESPIPETCNIWGEPIDPADNITSLLALTLVNFSLCQYETPEAFFPTKSVFFFWIGNYY